MKRSIVLLISTAMIITLGSCGQTKSNKEAEQIRINLAGNIDSKADPVRDFYQYACGGWMATNPIPEEYSRYGSFDKLGEDNEKQVHELIEGLAKQENERGSVAKKIGDLFKIGMDTATIESQGIKPLTKQLEDVINVFNKDKLIGAISFLHRQGVAQFFGVYVGADEMNSDMNILNVYQSGLGMPDRDYYLSEDEDMVNIKAAYKDHLNKMFQLAGYSEDEAKQSAEHVMKIEMELAKASYSRVELRDPMRNYNKMSITDLKKLAPTFDWDRYLKGINLADIEEINVGQKDFVVAFDKLYRDTPIEELKSYMVWSIINNAASYLNHAMVMQNFEFYGKTLSGTQELRPRWKRVVNVVNGILGEAVGEMYAAKYFPAESKERMLTLVAHLQDALRDRIRSLEWMSAETKEKAFEKLDAFTVKIGYPDKWRDYSALQIRFDSYLENILRSNEFEFDHNMSKAGKPVDRDEWLMTPQTVNAYYNPTTNEICFPAGILQPPFFDVNADDAVNYGAIGVVIGHEMTHGFDDQGRMYDKNGNLNDWWTEKDADKFNTRAQALAEYFNQIVVLGDLHANGAFTLGENIADQGGLALSYAAFQKALKENPVGKIDDFTPEQRFFLSYAGVWAGNIRDEEIVRRTKVDPHSLGRWRVNGTLPHLQQFHDAFGIKSGDLMYLAEDQRCLVW
ncbi:MAG: M13 family metallopeptidase [Bacteroidales bacterium]|jgi:putative endopeptidase|nr:M13 family metallopeptidase [Bacteroidales bacterium]